MKKTFFIVFLLVIAGVILLSGCSEDKYAPTASPYEGIQGTDYSEKSVPLQNSDAGDIKKMEITPSGDAACFLSPCDCNCYGIKGCVYRGDKCVVVK